MCAVWWRGGPPRVCMVCVWCVYGVCVWRVYGVGARVRVCEWSSNRASAQLRPATERLAIHALTMPPAVLLEVMSEQAGAADVRFVL